MKRIFFYAIAMLNAFFAQAQSKGRDIIAASGGFVTTPTAIVSYTLGETAIDYLSASGAIASQGFQQTSNTGSSIYGVKSLDAAVSTYPNPFVHFVEIKSDKMLNEPVFQIADAKGKMIQIAPVEIVKGKHWRIEVANIAAGNYWLNIIAGDKKGTYVLMQNAP